METVVRVRRIVEAGVPRFTFAVDGPPADDVPLNLSSDRPPINEFIDFRTTPGLNSTVIEAAGTAIFATLQQHSNGVTALASTIHSPVDGESREIRIHIENIARAAHNLPWEALHDPTDGFIALSREVPFRRVVPAVRPDAPRREHSFDGALRLVVIIAAADIPGLPQWEAFKAALRHWPANRNCLVLVDSDQLRKTIDQARLEGVSTGLVPTTGEELVRLIGDFAPQILHVFCHGQSEGGGVLEIATPNTAFGDAPLFIRPGQLAGALRATWVVVLNACSTGQVNPAVNTNSFACNLVEQGVPFVASMLQEVEASIAHRFADAFHARLLDDLRAQSGRRAPFTLQVAPAVMAARGSILAHYGCDPARGGEVKEWTLPILCSSTEPLQIHPTNLPHQRATETVARIRSLRLALTAMTFSDSARKAVEDEIDRLISTL
jgi:hypothetical protein